MRIERWRVCGGGVQDAKLAGPRRELSAGRWHHDIQGRVRELFSSGLTTDLFGQGGGEGVLGRWDGLGRRSQTGAGRGCRFGRCAHRAIYKNSQAAQTDGRRVDGSPDSQARLSARSDAGTSLGGPWWCFHWPHPIPLPPAQFRRDAAKGIETAVALAVELAMPPLSLPGPGARIPDTR